MFVLKRINLGSAEQGLKYTTESKVSTNRRNTLSGKFLTKGITDFKKINVQDKKTSFKA